MELDDRMFQEAMEAINRGERGRARDLLTRLIKEDPEKADYWLWMSTVVESVQERVYCLKEVLKLDPQNNIVRRGLILTGALPVDEKMVVPYEMQRRKWQVRLEKPVTLHTPWKQIFLFSGVCLLLFALAGWVFYTIRNNAAAIPVRPTRIYIPSTETTTPSPVVKASSNPTNSLPTPLWMLLPATYTPTPLYVNTPHPRTEAYRTALRAYQRGDYQAMLEYLNQASVIDQKSEDIFYYKGEAYRMIGDLGQATQNYQQALIYNNKFAPSYVGLAWVALASSPSREVEARADLEKALRLDPNYFEARLVLASMALDHQDADSALAQLKYVSSLAPDSTMLYFYRARAYILKEDLKSALVDARKAQELDTTYLPAYRLLGEAAYQSGDSATTIQALKIYTSYVPTDIKALTWLGAAYAANGFSDAALQTFELAINGDPQAPEPYLQRGLVYLNQKQADLAIKDFLDSIRFQKSFKAYISLGQAYLMNGNDRNAYVQFATAEGYVHNDTEKAQVFYWRAQSLQNIGETKAAIHDWQAMLDLKYAKISPDWIQRAKAELKALKTPTSTPVTPTPTRTQVPSQTSTATRTRLPVPTSSKVTSSSNP